MSYYNTKYVKSIFNRVSYRYDFFNDLFSLGLHRFWKKELINLLNPQSGEIWADLCCGTGDMAFLIDKKVSPNGSVIGFDNAAEILQVAQNRPPYHKSKSISWENKDIFDIDDKDAEFDGICMSYGLRNLNNVENGIHKVFLLLKENGRAGFLDFNHCRKNSLSSIFQKFYLRCIVVPIAGLFRLNKEYTYIEKSINAFPSGNELISISKKVGFKQVKYLTILGGQMGLLVLQK